MWKFVNNIVFDSYIDSCYIIFINRNKDFNFIQTTDLKHIVLIKDEKTIESFINYVKSKNKAIIYIKGKTHKNVLSHLTKDYDITIIEYGSSLKDEFNEIEPLLKSKISNIEKEYRLKEREVKENRILDEDDELDMTNIDSS